MPHRAFTAAQLRAMRDDEEVVLGDQLLPSLRQACTDRDVEWKNGDAARQLLAPRVRPIDYECAKLRALRSELECPICNTVPRAAELFCICKTHHHVCFSCLLSLLRAARQRGAAPACPMRCGALHIHEPPAPAFRGILHALDRPQSEQHSTAYQVYAGLHRCGYYTGSLHNADNLTHFVVALVDQDAVWRRAQECVRLHRHHAAYLHALPPRSPLPEVRPPAALETGALYRLLRPGAVDLTGAEAEAEASEDEAVARSPPPPPPPPPSDFSMDAGDDLLPMMLYPPDFSVDAALSQSPMASSPPASPPPSPLLNA